jgi:large subunit ribosomal protein L7Ae
MPVYVTYDVPADLQEDAIEALEVARDTGSVKKGTTKRPKPSNEATPNSS